ncbi:hypothetical protein D3C73_1359620 [compost metagenome]
MHALRRVAVLHGASNDRLGAGKNTLFTMREVADYVIFVNKRQVDRQMVQHRFQLMQ